MPELPLDNQERDPLARDFDRVGVPELVRRGPTSDTGREGVAVELPASGGRRPRPTARRSVDHAQQRADRQLDPTREPWREMTLHAQRSIPTSRRRSPFPRRTRIDAASRVEVGLGQRQRFLIRKPAAPEHDDQRPQPEAVPVRRGLAHHRDDLVDRRWIGRIQLALVLRGMPGVMAGHRRG